MYEVCLVDCWEDEMPSYYAIFKDGIQQPGSYHDEWEAIDDVKKLDPVQGAELEKFHASVM